MIRLLVIDPLHLILALGVFMSYPVFGRTLRPVEIFRRCYVQLTGQALKVGDPRITALMSNSLDPIEACETLLDHAEINSGDPDGRLVRSTDPEALAVLRNLYQVFNSFVVKPYAGTNASNFFEDFASTEDVQDFTAPGLVLTENMLNPNRQFKDIFSITRTPRASRELDSSVTYPFTMASLYGASYSATTNVFSPRSRHGQTFKTGTTPVNPDSVPYSLRFSSTVIEDQNFATISVGELTGIGYNSPVQFFSSSSAATAKYGDLSLSFDMNTTLFKGISFLRPYLLANTNWVSGSSPKFDLESMPRRLSRNILGDFLCRDLPAIRANDALGFVSSEANALPFRKGSTCVRCHATIDQMAGVYRGIGYLTGGDYAQTSLHRYMFIVHKAAPVAGFTAESGWPAVKDASFYKRPATGRLFYRSSSGGLVDVPLEDGDALSEQFAQQDDVYICQAKKMFKYFTGINVDITDIYDPDRADVLGKMSKKDWEYRNLVIQLGKNLKKHQKMRKTVSEIMRLDIYKKSDFAAGDL